MKANTILLVEDNPITCKLVRFTLEKEGFSVIQASDGSAALAIFPQHSVALVLQDLCLPDMDGFDLVSKLRKLPGGADIPILVFSGMLSQRDEARVSSAGFDDLIIKPVEPSRLVQILRSYLPPEQDAGAEDFDAGLRVVVADDDPVQRKLVSFRMQRAGFDVAGAADGNEALERARSTHPHAVVSDVLMPGLDGFGLCLELKKDPNLRHIPVVLTTNSYVEPTDRELARRAGAHDLVLRTPALREVFDALRASLSVGPSPARAPVGDDIHEEHMQRMMRQLERQVALNAGANQRCAMLAAEMTVLKGISEALASHSDIDEALRHTLAACFDAGGISLGALYLKEGDGLRVLSFGFSRDWSEDELQDFFGCRSLLDSAIEERRTRLLPSGGSSPEVESTLLERAGASSAIIAPLAHEQKAFGALVMLSRNGELQHEDRVKFGEAVASQISQALALAEAFRERERLEKAANEQAAILRSVLESIGDGVGVVDGHGKFILWNSAAIDLVKLGLPDERGSAHGRKLGIFESDTVTLFAFDRLPLVRAMRGEAVDGIELFVRHEGAPDGVWLSATGRPWRDHEGAARGAVGVFRDVTRDKATQAQLLVSDRMASVGMLAAGVAHEVNNPMASVIANLELSQRELIDREAAGDVRDTGELRDMLEDARSSAERVRQIVRDLKTFARHEEARPGAVDVHKVIESTLRMAWTEIRHRARLIKDYGTVPLVHGSDSRLGQVFLNLIVNAAQAIPEGDVESNVIRIVTCCDESGLIVVQIADSGSGIAPEDLKHLFRPFYTTKASGLGTGLGLAISHRIIAGLGGEIRVESELGRGTTFHVRLPPARSSAVVNEQPTRAQPRATRRARILVVDDDATMGQAIRRSLCKEHEVTVVMHAAEGLELIRTAEPFDVILCDLMMPQMTGMDLHAEVTKIDPAVAERLIFLTGGAFTPAARTFLDEVPNQRVDKPFEVQHLRALVNDRVK